MGMDFLILISIYEVHEFKGVSLTFLNSEIKANRTILKC